MKTRRLAWQYAVLAPLFIVACAVEAGHAVSAIDEIRHGDRLPDVPFGLAAATRTISSGAFKGDLILAINGKPFTGYRQFTDLIAHGHPGDPVVFTLSEPSGNAIERTVNLASRASERTDPTDYAVFTALNLVVPLLSMALGFFAVAVRPRDFNAWLLLAVLLGFTEAVRQSGWFGHWQDAVQLWNDFWTTVWPVSMMLFGIYFPTRSPLDRQMPWLKWLAAVPMLVFGTLYSIPRVIWHYSIVEAQGLRPMLVAGYFGSMASWIVAITVFFAASRLKRRRDPSADSRRRIRIMLAGCWLALSPSALLVLRALITRTDLFSGVPWYESGTAMLMLTLFPVTLAYSMVVQRAMDLSFVIRQSVQYTVAKAGLWLVRSALIGVLVYFVITMRVDRDPFTEAVSLTLLVAGIAALRQRSADRISKWIDRKFFRESYEAEKVLGELAAEVARFVEVQPLLEKVASRVGDVLHVPDIVILLRDGDLFRCAYSTRPGDPMDIRAAGRLAAVLSEQPAAVTVYLDDPPEWLAELSTEDLQSLAWMHTQVLLPLRGQEQLAGIMSLGPKLSEAPWSATDLQLLQAIGGQMGLALENTRLMTKLATEAAARERINREIEIAREVQERLFPKNPAPSGEVECGGYCRPARVVGGDYYDFLPLGNGRIGIAVGDVSGKGIGAALMMASLQASLRGQAMAGVHDLASLMANVNKLVYEASTSNRYATFFYGEYDIATRKLIFVNAGHNPPMILRGEQVFHLEAGGPVVGLIPFAQYEQSEFTFEPGDLFVAFTDGISEAQNEQQDEWEEERLLEAVRRVRDLSPEAIIRAVFLAADEFAGLADQYDDMTLVVLKIAA